MDKLMDSRWFMRIIALLLAILLYTSINVDEKELNKKTDTGQQMHTETILHVPVEVFYDKSNLVVSGVPRAVNVTIEGPKSIVQSTKALRDFTVYIDLKDAKIGKQKVRILHQDISDKLDVTIDPAYAEVSVQEKITAEFGVEAEVNKALLAEGYEAGQPVVEPKVVQVTGAKDVIEQINFVRATIEMNDEINGTVTREAKVQVLDRELNKLDVDVEPETVKVTIPVENISKKVPVSIKQTGSPKDGISINSISPTPKEVTIYGSQDTLNKVDKVDVNVDVNDIEKNTEMSVPVNLPKGIKRVSDEKVSVKIAVEQKEKAKKEIEAGAKVQQEKKAESNSEQTTETKTFKNIKITPQGLDEQAFSMELISPSSGTVNVTASGGSKMIKDLNIEQIKVMMNVSGLDAGEHDIDLEVKGPNGISWNLSDNKAKIRLIEKDSDNV